MQGFDEQANKAFQQAESIIWVTSENMMTLETASNKAFSGFENLLSNLSNSNSMVVFIN